MTFLYDLRVLIILNSLRALSKIDMILHLIFFFFFALEYLPSHSYTEKNPTKYMGSMLDQLDIRESVQAA